MARSSGAPAAAHRIWSAATWRRTRRWKTEIAAFVGFPRALTFSTGYLANLAIIPTLASRGGVIFSDKLNHASLIDAMQLAKAHGAETQRYAHCDMAALETAARREPTRNEDRSSATPCSAWTAISRRCRSSSRWPSATTPGW